MKKPSVNDCLDEIRRLRAENERLTRLVKTKRPELSALREVAVAIRDWADSVPRLSEKVEALLAATNEDDLPSFDEFLGCLSDGSVRVDAALSEAAPPEKP